jgi:hypothetical protein
MTAYSREKQFVYHARSQTFLFRDVCQGCGHLEKGNGGDAHVLGNGGMIECRLSPATVD